MVRTMASSGENRGRDQKLWTKRCCGTAGRAGVGGRLLRFQDSLNIEEDRSMRPIMTRTGPLVVDK